MDILLTTIQTPPTVAIADEDGVFLAPVEQDDAQQASPLTQAVQWTPRSFLDDELLSFTHVGDEDMGYSAQVQVSIWIASAFVGDELFSANVVDDEYTMVGTIQLISWSNQVAVDHEETSLAVMIEQEDGWTGRVEIVAWKAVWFVDEEMIVIISPPCPYRPASTDQPNTFDLSSDFGFAFQGSVDDTSVYLAQGDDLGTWIGKPDESDSQRLRKDECS